MGAEKCRRLTGGAGYASFSGFTELIETISPVPTYEGDNTVMMLQATRYVFKLSKMASKNKKLPYPFAYINDAENLLSLRQRGVTVDEVLDVSFLE